MPKPTALLKGFEKQVAAVKVTGKRQVISDPETTGLCLMVSAKGKRSFSILARDPEGKQVWKRIGDPATMTVAKARQEAAEAVARVKAGEAAVLPPEAPQAAPETFKAVAERFLERHVDKKALRTAPEIKRQFKKYIYPAWEAEPFTAIRRGKVVELLHKIEDGNGSVMADRVLATLRKLFNWVEVNGEDEEYKSPVVRGMRIVSAKDSQRKRILTDDEIRALWADWSTAGTFGAFLQTCLLTAQRRAKVQTMRWQDVSSDGVWTIPAEPREKINAGTLKLPKLALDIIASRPQIAENSYVFAGRGKTPIGNLGNDKAAMGRRVQTEPWTIHDLRRTAKSLMARAGVRPDISERTLGHVIQGVEGVYDQHDYAREKAEALAALASLVERILKGDADNVVQLASAR